MPRRSVARIVGLGALVGVRVEQPHPDLLAAVLAEPFDDAARLAYAAACAGSDPERAELIRLQLGPHLSKAFIRSGTLLPVNREQPPEQGEEKMANDVTTFREYRQRMNERILASGNLGIKRFFALDSAAYRDGALPAATKELLGLASSMVLRCNDCIDYHLGQSVEAGCSDEEIIETMQVSLVVGGSIVIPHLRHAFETLDHLRADESNE